MLRRIATRGYCNKKGANLFNLSGNSKGRSNSKPASEGFSLSDRITPKHVNFTAKTEGSRCSYDVSDFIKKHSNVEPTSISAVVQDIQSCTKFVANDWIVHVKNVADCDELMATSRNSEIFSVSRGAKGRRHLVKDPKSTVLLSGLPYDFATKQELQGLFGEYRITVFKLLGESSCYTKQTTDWLLSFKTEEEALTFEAEQSGKLIGGRRIYASTI